MKWAWALFIVTIGGGIFVGAILGAVRISIYPRVSLCVSVFKCMRECFQPLVLLIGTTERTVAMILFAYSPSFLVSFMSGWIAAKYVNDWAKRYEPYAREETLLALVGTTLSFAVAIGAGYLLNPEHLCYFVCRKANGF